MRREHWLLFLGLLIVTLGVFVGYRPLVGAPKPEPEPSPVDCAISQMQQAQARDFETLQGQCKRFAPGSQ